MIWNGDCEIEGCGRECKVAVRLSGAQSSMWLCRRCARTARVVLHVEKLQAALSAPPNLPQSHARVATIRDRYARSLRDRAHSPAFLTSTRWSHVLGVRRPPKGTDMTNRDVHYGVTPGQFQARAEAVYWHGARHCPSRSAGATCVLEPGHDGPHEGNATDQIVGPKYRLWTEEDTT